MASRTDLSSLLAAKEMVLVCGAGGVGKTTIAAAMAAHAARELDGRVLVVTVDPAKRLADALGVTLGNEPRRVDAAAVSATPGGGELWAAMLDTKAGWDELIRRHAPDRRVRDSMLANPLYDNLTRRFVHSHDYLAMELLHELHGSGRYDLIVVDTPPSRNALAVLDAPARMREFFGSRLLKWLTVPYRSRLFTAASKPFYQVADRVLGARFLQDIAEFFVLFQRMERSFVSHATQVERLLVDPRTAFVVVTTLEAAPVHEATYLAQELTRRRLPLGAIVANRTLPPKLVTRATTASARRLASVDPAAAGRLAAVLDLPSEVTADGLHGIGEAFATTVALAAREAERTAELATLTPILAAVPILDGDVDTLDDLIALARWFTT